MNDQQSDTKVCQDAAKVKKISIPWWETMIIYFLIAWGIERIVYVIFYRPHGPVSVSQTTIAEHTPLRAPVGVSQTTTTNRTVTPAPLGVSQTTVTESTNTQASRPL